MSGPDGPGAVQLLAALPDAALLFGPDRRLVAANPPGRALFDLPEGSYTATQALGTAQLVDLVEEAAASDAPAHMATRVDRGDLEAIAAPVGDHVLLLLRDQTARSRVDAVRRDFVANASHEMKTPVSGIQALADALTVTTDQRDHDRSRELAERLASEAARLGRLITELLSLRRLEEESERPLQPVDLVQLLDEELERVAGRARAHDLRIVRHLPTAARIAGSQADLRLVVSNLLDNAVGYNRDGGSITVELAPAGDGWRLEVVDTGIGIPRDDLDRVFERFYRVDIARSRASGGTGLGLAIVRHAVERHGGVVRVESILGEGSRFVVELPVTAPADTDLGPP